MSRSPKTIWLVATEMHPFAGGIGVYTHHTARMLSQAGLNVTVLFHDCGTQAPVVSRPHGYRLIRFAHQTLAREPIDAPNLHGPLKAAFETCAVLKNLIADAGPPDLIEAQDYGALAYFFLKHRLTGMGPEAPRTILTAHRPHIHCATIDEADVYDHRTAFLGDAERWCYAAADAVFAPSAFIVEALKRPGMDFPGLVGAPVVHNPFDPQTIGQAPAEPLAQAACTTLRRAQYTRDEPLLFFGKLQNQKGPWDLLASLAALANEGRAHPLWLWGRDAVHAPSGTTTYDFLERRYRALFDARQVRMFGAYGLGGLRDLCASHPICLLPYREECLPYAFIEVVLSGGIPLFGANGGQGELVAPQRRERLLTDFRRPDMLEAQIAWARSLGEAERQALSQALRADVLAKVGYDAVLPGKLAALEEVTLRSTAPNYPFVHGEAKVFASITPDEQADLAHAVPQRGLTLSLRACPGEQAHARDGLVSVIVPYYEMQAFVDDTLACIEAQLHDAVEIILVDDGSPSPAARAKLDEIAARPRRFPLTLVRKYNAGLADARNAGARLARGEFLYFLDADDTIHPTTLAAALRVLRRFPNVAYVGASLKEFGDSEQTWTAWDIDAPYIGFHNLQICAFLIRAQAWLRFGANDPEMSLGMEDYESHVRMFAAGVRGVGLPHVHFNYRKRAGSMSRAFNVHSTAFLQRRVIANNRDFYRHYGPELVGLYAENGHGALAPSVTVETPAHAALFGGDIATVDEIETRLEQTASREGLSRALRARAVYATAQWDYIVGRLLLALGTEPSWAEALLAQAAARAPDNGWFALYAIIAHLRAGRTALAQGLWTDGFSGFCRRELDAVLWVAQFESLRGYPHIRRAFAALLSARLGLESSAIDGEGADDRFHATRRALTTVLDVVRAGAIGAEPARHAAASFLTTTGDLASPEACAALLCRWLLLWRESGEAAAAQVQAFAEHADGEPALPPGLLGLFTRAAADAAFAGPAGLDESTALSAANAAALQRPGAAAPTDPARTLRAVMNRVVRRR